LIFTALLFKTAAVPFHFWSPDVYEGAPTPVTAYMATILKLGTFAAFAVFYNQVNAYLLPEIQLGLAGVAGLTLLVANLMATVQTNAKRLLAFSSISHSGFMLTGIVSQASMEQLAYYLVVYGIASMTAFKVLYSLPENASNSQYRGLLYQRPHAAVALILSLLSMAGLPPLSGFLAKYNVLAAAVKNDYLGLAVIGVLASMLAIYYYLSIIIQVCKKTESSEQVPSQTLEWSDAIFYGFVTIVLIGFLVVPF
jgi:NADH-quinone oxidoreductase subunit N